MDQQGQRTLWIGFLIGLALYGLGFVAPYLFAPPRGAWIALILTAMALVFMGVWVVAVLRGWRIGKSTRQGRRLKDRRPPAHQRRRF